MSKLVSGRVKKTPQSGITSDRYEFLGLEQAEPDLGDPLVGPSSIAAKPYPIGSQYVLINVGGQTGERYWIRSTNLIQPGLTPGSFTIFNNGTQVGAANSFNIFNFVGAGVTVDFVDSNPEDQTGIATVRIEVVDVQGPGNIYEIPYHDPTTGFLRGATGIVFRNNNVGIGSTIPTEKLDVLGNAAISGTLGVSTVSVGFATVTTLSIGSSVRLYGPLYDYLGNSGVSGEVLVSNGSNPPAWGIGATSTTVTTKEATNDQLYYIGFSSTTDDASSFYVDSNGLYYNPSSTRLGIGTQPQYELDVEGTIRADSIIVNSLVDAPGIVTTTSTNTVVVDSFLTSQYRSARYSVQITANNQLQLGTGSVSGIQSGTNYSPGTYNDVALVSSGIGTGATADIVVSSVQLPITGSFEGVFTTTTDLSGITTGLSVSLDSTLVPTDYDQSKLAEIQVSNSGVGFTSIPGITIDAPIIAGNPVSGVGVGSTAIVTDVSMKVTNVVLNTSGIVTNTVPTATFNTPIGIGETAEGYVGFGISTFTVTNAGSAYTTPPTVTYNQTPTVEPVTIVGLGISDANIQITAGTGYNTGVTTITVNAVGGIGTDATIILGSVDGLGGITDIDITNVGFGYFTIPTITITNTGSGVGAAITITEMIVANVDVINPGSGFGTSKPSIGFTGGGGSGAAATVTDILLTSVEVTNSGFGYTSADIPVTVTIPTPGVGTTVGLGIYSVTATTGLGYTTNPSFTIDSPTISPLTGAALTSVVGYGTAQDLFPGPGYGGTTSYYIDPIDSTTFKLTTDSSVTDYIFLGYDITSNPNAYTDGQVTSVSITNSGSGYEVGEILVVANSDITSIYNPSVGTGFSFTVSGPLIDNFQVSDILLLQTVGSASTEAAIVEYAGIESLESLGDYSADIDGSNARLKFTPTYAHNTVKVTRKATEI